MKEEGDGRGTGRGGEGIYKMEYEGRRGEETVT